MPVITASSDKLKRQKKKIENLITQTHNSTLTHKQFTQICCQSKDNEISAAPFKMQQFKLNYEST